MLTSSASFNRSRINFLFTLRVIVEKRVSVVSNIYKIVVYEKYWCMYAHLCSSCALEQTNGGTDTTEPRNSSVHVNVNYFGCSLSDWLTDQTTCICLLWLQAVWCFLQPNPENKDFIIKRGHTCQESRLCVTGQSL